MNKPYVRVPPGRKFPRRHRLAVCFGKNFMEGKNMEFANEQMLRPSVARERLNRLQPMLARHLAGMGSESRIQKRRHRLFERLDLPCRSLESFFWNRFQRGDDCYLAGEVATDLVCELLVGKTAYKPTKGKLGSWLSSAIQCDILDLLARERTRLDHHDRLALHGENLRRRQQDPVGYRLEREELLRQAEILTESLGNPREMAVGQGILRSLRDTGDLPVQTRLAEELGMTDTEVTRSKQGWLTALRGPLADRAVVLQGGFVADTPGGVLKA